jgi:type I restriction enzyme S subunit
MKGWRSEKLGELCQIELGKTPSRREKRYWDEDKTGGNVWLSIADMPLDSRATVFDSKEYLSSEGAAVSKVVPKETLIVSFKLSLGRVAITKRDLYTNEAIAALYIKDDTLLLRDYLLWYLTFFDWDAAAGSDVKVKGKTLNKAKLKEIDVFLPEVEEQKRIVAILDEAFADIDKARALMERNLENARELFESYLLELFGKPNKDWKVEKLKALTSKIGSGATPKGGKASYKSEGISLIRSMNVYDRAFKYKDLAFIDESQANKLSNVVVEPNDILLNITGASVARCCIVPQDVLPARVNQHVSIIRLGTSELSPCFLNYGLTSRPYKAMLLGIGEAGSTRQAITKRQIEEFEFAFPASFDEQNEIIESIQKLNQQTVLLASKYEKKLLSLEELKKSLLQKAFTGELTRAVG